ncbi:DUF362 domain-containing protein [bacterium]|nr:DUF362 domain-containing protein [candidate division CSSED10-310 bacterium]
MMAGDTRVALISVPGYSGLDRAVERLAELLEYDPPVARVRVLIKPNLRSGNAPEKAVNTHPEVLRAVISFFQYRLARVVVGDSCGVYGYTGRCLSTSGMVQVIRDTHAELLNFDKGTIVEEKVRGAVLKSIFLAREIRSCEYLVTVPKLKTHSLMGMTGALKNHVGFLPGGTKARLHMNYPDPEGFAEAVMDLNGHLPSHFTVMDAVVGMEGDGPARGTPIQTGLLIAGMDPAAVDRVATLVMGLAPERVPLLAAAGRRGYTIDLTKITALGEDPAAVAIQYRPARMKRTEALRWLYVLRNRHKERAVTLRIDKDRCSRCGYCAAICPVQAIRLDPHPKFAKRRCIYCYSCQANCPSRAITLRTAPWVTRMVRSQIDGGIDG